MEEESMRHMSRVVVASVAVLVAVSIGIPASSSAANLVKNRSFEVGTFSSWSHNGMVGIDQVMYHRSGTRSVAVGGAFGYTSQRVSVASFAGLIDANGASVTTGCYHTGYEAVSISATFLDAGGKRISGKSAAGPPPLSFTAWKRLSLTRIPVPPRTRSIKLRIQVKDVLYGDTNWDDAFLMIVNR